MRAVIQRVSQANVLIDADGKYSRADIGKGLVVFVGIENADTDEDIQWLSHKIVNLRIFDDVNRVPNISVKEAGGDILAISQFTLHAAIKKGNRPSYIKASKAETAIPVYEKFIIRLAEDLGKIIHTGSFGADMKVELINDGPVTIWIDTKHKE
jgi:D-tyrosyl-tRNA(Tyr) deacylase